ncbi:thioredoxin domain-containing protein [Hephaestia sp. GCM10023244]|uniref:thioredoxin domain-containing protein n=1 Tax=unclassified Hephaestia TaxID=2631281 RepID=UPI002077926E|nr:thioredoxin domain-containing protein [Hephaestia sp. MAHUQ-44]MCM8729684.1 DsbA family protein [Hephaestia sp. MAHUQ-44]
MAVMTRLLALIGFALLAGAAAPAPQARDWTRTVTQTASGSFVMGNPGARVKVIEYLSYTCPHCAAFTHESAPVLRGQMIKSGKVSLELRNAVREKLDLAAAALARCAGKQDFFGATDALLASQHDWYPRGAQFIETNGRRLGLYPESAQLRAYADGAGLTALMKARGLRDAAIDGCFSPAALAPVLGMTSEAWGKISGTPTFFVNGKIVPNAHWHELQPVLTAAGA